MMTKREREELEAVLARGRAKRAKRAARAAARPHCECCGEPDPAGHEGYTVCCNELVLWPGDRGYSEAKKRWEVFGSLLWDQWRLRYKNK